MANGGKSDSKGDAIERLVLVPGPGPLVKRLAINSSKCSQYIWQFLNVSAL